MDTLLHSIYYDYKNPGSLASVDKLHEAASLKLPHVTRKHVEEWLSRQPSFTLHKQAINKFQRNRVLVSSIDEEFQADLMDIRNVSRVNGGFKYLLNVIDVLSKYAFSIPVKQKSGPSVAAALRKIFSERIPSKLHTDRGLEFQNSQVKGVLDEFEVFQTSTKDKLIKASIVERFNRTLRMKLARLKTQTGSNKFIHVLPDILESYNNTKHSSIRMKPSEVTIDNQDIAFNNLYGGKSYLEMLNEARSKKLKFKLGDFVRLKVEKQTFERGYSKSWSDQVFRVNRIITSGQVPTFYIRDSMNQELPRKYYTQDLQKIGAPGNHVEKILQKRRRNINNQLVTEYLVLYKETQTQAWIPESDIFNIKIQ